MSRIIATGAYLPGQAWSNDQLINAYQLESSDEWIVQRTGIHQRYFAAEHETVAMMASEAAKQLLKNLSPDIVSQIRHIVVATMSAKAATPSIACQVQAMIGAEGAWGFDLNGACSGFVMAMEVANRLAASQTQGYTLVIGAEKMSQIVDLTDRTTAVLFGDGAGAVLIQHDGQELSGYASQVFAQGRGGAAIEVHEASDGQWAMQMQGRDVFNFVKRTVIKTLANFIEQNDFDIDYLICHQANQRLLNLIADKLSLEEGKVPANIAQAANTSAGSIPILLDQLVRDGRLRLDGTQSIILSGFGAGLAWGHLHLSI